MTDSVPSPREPSAHDDYVASGACPNINWAKTWCNGDAGHPEPHHAPLLLPDGRKRQVFWTDDGEFLP